jgi:GNAT superfamily N-acetyltransferase
MVSFHPLTVPLSDCARLVRAFFFALWGTGHCVEDADGRIEMAGLNAVTVRLARPREVAALSDIIFRSRQSNGYDDAFMEACRDELGVTAATLSERSYWVAEDGALLGCAALADGAEPDAGEIHAFFIDPTAQRRGIGRALWAVIWREAMANGWRRLTLDADPAAVPFYERLGFCIIGDSPSGSIPGRMIPLMAIDLLPPPPQE